MQKKETAMRKLIALIFATLLLSALGAPPASAGSPHFVNNGFSISSDGTTLTVSAKEAGLGDETQIHVVLDATALCINPGGHHPKAVNKQSISSDADVPVQNGKADYTLTVTASFTPECVPPMTVVFTNVTITDTTNGLTKSFSGTF